MRDVTDRKGRLRLPLTRNTYIEVRGWEVIFLIYYFLFTFFVKVAHVNYEQHTHIKSSLIRLSVYRMDAHSVIVRNRISICFYNLLVLSFFPLNPKSPRCANTSAPLLRDIITTTFMQTGLPLKVIFCLGPCVLLGTSQFAFVFYS